LENIEETNILTIENKDYVVASIVEIDNIKYYYLININKENKDIKFCKFHNDEFYEIFDTNLIEQLFKEVVKKAIDKI